MLIQEVDRVNMTLASRPGFCSLRFFRAIEPGRPATLDAVAQFFDIDCGFHRLTHGALIDAELTAAVVIKYLSRKR